VNPSPSGVGLASVHRSSPNSIKYTTCGVSREQASGGLRHTIFAGHGRRLRPFFVALQATVQIVDDTVGVVGTVERSLAAEGLDESFDRSKCQDGDGEKEWKQPEMSYGMRYLGGTRLCVVKRSTRAAAVLLPNV
jgi:hypothetical protein